MIFGFVVFLEEFSDSFGASADGVGLPLGVGAGGVGGEEARLFLQHNYTFIII